MIGFRAILLTGNGVNLLGKFDTDPFEIETYLFAGLMSVSKIL